ncbi:MAG: glycosyltransferase family 9 protein [Candidatus Eremiobacteraeota bacterium]|nr:glycosyltransferase family 9 protein [Candidatus Eremiobacteraeota bacterium]
MRIVILRALKLGDFLTAVPAYRAIRRAFPSARIVLAAPREFGSLAELLDGAIDEVADTRELAPLPAHTHHADLGIDLHGAGPLSHRLLLATHPRRLIAFRNAAIPESADCAEHDAAEHEVYRWCRLLTHAGIPADPHDLDVRVPAVSVPKRVRGATLIHPGAASESRRWPVERWIDVARAERRLGRRIVITGGPGEIELARSIAAGAGIPSTHVYAGRTNLRELAALVAAAARVVCGDTGVAHLATAFHRPSVLLFGPTPPALWGPPSRPYHRVLWNGTTGDPHADRIDPGLAAIPSARVIAALDAC